MSPTPAGSLLDAATGSFSWTPTAGTTPVTTRALIDEGSTFTPSSVYSPEYTDPKLTSPKGFKNSGVDDDYSNTVQFVKDLRVHKFTLMKRANINTNISVKLINYV